MEDPKAELTLEAVEKQLTTLEKSLETANVRIARAETVTKMEPEDFAVYKSFTEAQQEEFFKADAAGQEALLEKGRKKPAMDDEEDDEDEEPVGKRYVELSKRLEEAEARVTAAEAVAKSEMNHRKLVEFSKRAEKELSNLPGTADEKGAILKSLNEKLTPEEFEGVHKLLTAGNEAFKTITSPVGKSSPSTGTGNDAWSTIEKRATALVAANSAKTVAEGVSKVLDTEEGKALYSQYLEESGKQ